MLHCGRAKIFGLHTFAKLKNVDGQKLVRLFVGKSGQVVTEIVLVGDERFFEN